MLILKKCIKLRLIRYIKRLTDMDQTRNQKIFYSLRSVESAYIHHSLRYVGVKCLFFILHLGQKGRKTMDQVKIGKFISNERKAKGYTQKQLSELLGYLKCPHCKTRTWCKKVMTKEC